MFNFDQERFLKTQAGAVATNEQISNILESIASDLEEIYFIGSGGVGILLIQQSNSRELVALSLFIVLSLPNL
ncbi:hypothetical protein LOS20_06295 [Enterococcus faecium]|nr:hypothetical protein [Enterococcus sp. 079]MCC9081954.1 hypothetical protein [Enterococcus faecium]